MRVAVKVWVWYFQSSWKNRKHLWFSWPAFSWFQISNSIQARLGLRLWVIFHIVSKSWENKRRRKKITWIRDMLSVNSTDILIQCVPLRNYLWPYPALNYSEANNWGSGKLCDHVKVILLFHVQTWPWSGFVGLNLWVWIPKPAGKILYWNPTVFCCWWLSRSCFLDQIQAKNSTIYHEYMYVTIFRWHIEARMSD